MIQSGAIPGPLSPAPRAPPFATCSRWRPPSREDSDAVPAAGFGWNLKSLFLVRCYASRVLTRNVCVCEFCFVKVKFVFLSNITSFIYLRACYGFFVFFEPKGKKTPQNPYTKRIL